MEKYLGNKATLLPLLERFFVEQIPEAKSISDVFAGTNNVSRYFRARGWQTATCDVNRFSYVLAQAYLCTSSSPHFFGVRLPKMESLRSRQLQTELERNVARYGALYAAETDIKMLYRSMGNLPFVLSALQDLGENNTKPGIIYEHFSQWGAHSSFISKRGTSGKRNYFSLKNALFLDGVLNCIREWWCEGRLERNEVFLLLASVLEETVITANVNGTFHDFNRDRLWPNAEQNFQLRLPLISFNGPIAETANADAIAAAASFAHHDICYLDPPYNFRQYSAYYHLLNFIAAYPFFSEIETYVTGLAHVRGQHPEDDFTSDFCFRDRFISSLHKLMSSVDADHVVVSYYGGRNHWNHWANVENPTDEGLHQLKELFEDRSLFKGCEIIPALEIRKNYQSRVGEQKSLVNEYLFHGIRQKILRKTAPSLPSLAANERWGLAPHFGHIRPSKQNGVNQGVVTSGGLRHVVVE
ncbi:DNA adenine methylase [Herbaspirillum aquaticum]|nr:DNA adenine methylase [Herbaspirillum aquaticum]